MDNVLKLPLTNNYIENRIMRLKQELIDSDVDHLDPILTALIIHLRSTHEVEHDENLQDCYSLLYGALLSYRRFSGEISLKGIDDL